MIGKYNRRFLEKLYEHKIREVRTKIELLDWNEKVLGEISGIVLNGSYNVDGSSSVRRNVSLTLSVEDRDEKLVYEYLDLSKKIRLYTGLRNFTDEHLDEEVIWFNLGTYVLLDPSYSHNVNELRMTLQAQDKMALMNGVLGGTLPTATSFAQRDSKTGKVSSLSWREIFYYAATIFGEENPARVVAESVPDFINDYTQVKTVGGLKHDFIHVEAPEDMDGERIIVKAWHPEIPSKEVKFSQTDRLYKLRKFGPPDPQDSNENSEEMYMKNAGEPVSSVFDDIVENLSFTHEYFYTVEGDLVLQKIQTYINETFDPDKAPDLGYASYDFTMDDYMPDFSGFPFVYDFSDKESVTAYSNNPAWTNVKNNFVAIGQEGQQTIQVAIDKKPTIRELREWFIKFLSEFEDNPESYDLEFLRLDGNGERMPYNPEDDTVPFLYKEPTDSSLAVYIDVPLGRIPWQIGLGLKNYMIRNLYSKIGQERVLPRWGTECESMIFKWVKSTTTDKLVPNTGIFNVANIPNSAPWLAGFRTLSPAESVEENEGIDFGSPLFTQKGDPTFWTYFFDIIDENTHLGKYSIDKIGKRTVVESSEHATTMFRVMPKSLIVLTEQELEDIGGETILKDLRDRKQAYAIIRDHTDQRYLRGEYYAKETKDISPYRDIVGNPAKNEHQYYSPDGIMADYLVGGKMEGGGFQSNMDASGKSTPGTIAIKPGRFTHPLTGKIYDLPSTIEGKFNQIETPVSEANIDDQVMFIVFRENLEDMPNIATNDKHFFAAKLEGGEWYYSRVSELIVPDKEKHKELVEKAKEDYEELKRKAREKYDQEREAALKKWEDSGKPSSDFKYPEYVEPKPEVDPNSIKVPDKVDRAIIWSKFRFDTEKRGDVIVGTFLQNVRGIQEEGEEEEILASGEIDYIGALFNVQKAELTSLFSSAGAVDLFSKVREMIYNKTNFAEVITLTTLPVYHLEPNTLIRVEDERANIYGVYMITSFGIPFSTSGGDLMSINAIKVNQRI